MPIAPGKTTSAPISAATISWITIRRLVGAEAGRQYLELARRQLLSLSSPVYRARAGGDGCFMLRHSVGHIPEKHEIDVPLNYADYYCLEALLRHGAQ